MLFLFFHIYFHSLAFTDNWLSMASRVQCIQHIWGEVRFWMGSNSVNGALWSLRSSGPLLCLKKQTSWPAAEAMPKCKHTQSQKKPTYLTWYKCIDLIYLFSHDLDFSFFFFSMVIAGLTWNTSEIPCVSFSVLNWKCQKVLEFNSCGAPYTNYSCIVL